MDSEQGKLFVGGISWDTTEEKLKEHFGQFGDVLQANIMKDKATGRPRGFGFVVFSDPSSIDTLLLQTHTIDGRTVEAKRAMSREEQQNTTRPSSNNGGRSVGGGGNFRTKKIFVGGLPPNVSDEGFRQYFESFGNVNDVVIMYDQNTQRPRGFGFITFDNEEAVDRVLQKTFHDLNGKQVEVKRALPKDANPGMTNRGNGGGGFNSSGNQSSYDSRMDSNRFMQPQNTGGAFPAYGSSGYGAAGYGYGPTNNAMAYGGYGYAGANPGYGPPASATYANPNVPSGGQRGYGPTGYGSGRPVAQSPNTVSGYGAQGYGYGGYGGAGGYGASSNTSGVGGGATGEMQGGYGSGYGDANGHGAYGAQMAYGGYGGAQNRQGQQQ